MLIIIPYFDYSDSQVLYDNHLKTLDWLSTQGHHVVTIEGGMGDTGKLAHTATPGHHYIYRKLKDVLWQKEAMINEAWRVCKELGLTDGAVMWLDSGCTLEDGVLNETERMLCNGYDFVQPFSKVHYIGIHGSILLSKPGAVSNALGTPHRSGGAPGGAFAARDTFFEHLGMLYPYSVVGAGDAFFLDAILGIKIGEASNPSEGLRNDIRRWGKKLYAGSYKIGYIEGPLRHLWHMANKNRNIGGRSKIMKDGDFNPRRHVRLDEGGMLMWNPKLKYPAILTMKAAVAEYLDRRNNRIHNREN